MNEEIKEILEALKPHNDIIKEYPLTLSIEEQKLLLDYITNLQQENDILNDITESYEETSKEQHEEIEDYKSRCEKAIEYIENIKHMTCRYYDYDEWRKRHPYGSIEKLHEEIKKDGTLEGHFVEVNRDIILNILNGGDDK